MKQKDIAVVIIIVFMAAVFSIMISKFVFKTSEKNLQAEIVTPISADFTEPDDRYFNEQSVNPTQIIRIGDGANSQPFSQ